MTPALSAVYDELLARAAVPPFRDGAERLRRAFFARTGEPGEETEAFAVRLAAAWEDVLVGPDADGGCLAATLGETLEDEAERDIAHLLARGQRGLFEVRTEGDHRFAFDHLGGASFLLLRGDALARATGTEGDDRALVIGRLVGAYDGCTLLPGAVFLPAAATPLLPDLLVEARARGLGRDTILDALLRMDNALATLSRVKPAFAFRVQSLPRGEKAPEP